MLVQGPFAVGDCLGEHVFLALLGCGNALMFSQHVHVHSPAVQEVWLSISVSTAAYAADIVYRVNAAR